MNQSQAEKPNNFLMIRFSCTYLSFLKLMCNHAFCFLFLSLPPSLTLSLCRYLSLSLPSLSISRSLSLALSLSLSLSLSVALSLAVQRTSPAVMVRKRRKTPCPSRQAPPSPALPPPTAGPSWTAQPLAACHWTGHISCRAAPPTGVWMKCVDSFHLCKVGTMRMIPCTSEHSVTGKKQFHHIAIKCS